MLYCLFFPFEVVGRNNLTVVPSGPQGAVYLQVSDHCCLQSVCWNFATLAEEV